MKGRTGALLYLDLLKRSVAGLVQEDAGQVPGTGELSPFDREKRRQGLDWPTRAETMIGLARLDNLQDCVIDVIRRRIPGDLIEAGVWRGGATILMRGVLAAFDATDRTVWVADSFEGLPKPDPEKYPVDQGDEHWRYDELRASVEEVRHNFARYGLLDAQVAFLPGWFKDTLPGAPVDRLALMRLDGDMYESTIVALDALYPRLSVGGYVIVDDYALPGCRAAVDDFRAERAVQEEMHVVDWTGVYWMKAT